jgi:hypothetical protein
MAQTPDTKKAKYHCSNGDDDPFKQLDLETWIQPCKTKTGECHYRADGY